MITFMKKILGVCVFIGFAVIAFLRLGKMHDEAMKPSAKKDIIEIAVALSRYAEDHDGKLPEDLSPLSPTYIANTEWFRKTTAQLLFAKPGARLSQLTPTTIVLRQKQVDENGYVAVAYANMKVELKPY